jgi:ubiquinone/menaquinone biosynthesis C-methylase UbiE
MKSWSITLLLFVILIPSFAEEKAPPARTHYEGRRVAQTMHYLGAKWLMRDTRQRQEDCSTLLKELQVKPGQVICDLGCGNGFYSLKLAKLVGKKGKIVGVDIQKEMLNMLEKNAKGEGYTVDRVKRGRSAADGQATFELILGAYHDPYLAPDSLDMIILVDVYHEFSHPALMLKSMRSALKKEGVLVLAEFRMEDPKVPIKLLHKMSKDQVMKEVPQNGYKLVREFNGLPWQHLMFFQRDDGPTPAIKPKPWKKAN